MNLIKNKITVLLYFFACILYSQENQVLDDIRTPNTGAISGQSHNVNESTGKLSLNIPIASISHKRLSYSLNIAYNGSNVFDQAQYVNKYAPTGTLGLGWGISSNKITCDTKSTGTREDDTFYLDGVELVRTGEYYAGTTFWVYEPKKFDNRKIEYNVLLDRWEVTQENGDIHTYGGNAASKEIGIKWGNWIGDSKNIGGASNHTIAWNLSSISDQWDNNIQFIYTPINQRINSSSSLSHTEASYIKEIHSDAGKIIFTYGNKVSNEYYEPHTEQAEPDAFQERYEKKYLRNVKYYNRNAALIETFDFTYTLSGVGQLAKRLLKSMRRTGNEGADISLPPHEFEYFLTGDFRGGLKKVINPSGGFTEYSYENKALFTNYDQIVNDGPNTGGYCTEATYAGNSYSLKLLTQGCINNQDDYRVKIDRYFWNGEKWKKNQFIIPEMIRTDSNTSNGGSGPNQKIDNLKFTFGEDFYGFLYFNRDTDRASLYLFHLNDDGTTWNKFEKRNFILESKDNDHKDEDPILINGENFVGVGTQRSGKLYTFTWNGRQLNEKLINQGYGQYYYGAKNNFILSLDEDGGNDMVTGANHQDKYYIHYLDAEKRWQTKSWSAFADPYIAGIEKPSFFYPSNSMTGFVADDNPELFLRWTEGYNLTAVENIVGFYSDKYPFIALNNIFTIHNSGNFGYVSTARRTAAFNGSTWKPFTYSGNPYYFGYTENRMAYLDISNRRHFLNTFNPNNENWSLSPLTNPDFQTSNSNAQGIGFTNDLLLIGNYSYRLNNNGTWNYVSKFHNNFASRFTETNYNLIYKGLDTNNNGYDNLYYLYYLDKRSNSTILEAKLVSSSLSVDFNRDSQYFGGYSPFLSKTTLVHPNGNRFNRIIEDDVKTLVEDIVVDKITKNSLNGGSRITELTYNDYNITADDQLVYYGNVTVRNRGFGSGNIGRIVNFYDNGEGDSRMAGLPLRSEYYSATNMKVKEVINTWTKFNRDYRNSLNKVVGTGFFFRQTNSVENFYFDNNKTLSSSTASAYNTDGQVSSTTSTTSTGSIEKRSIYYAHQQYPFVKNKNIFLDPYETNTKLDGQIVDYQRNVWVNVGGKVYLKEKLSGPTVPQIRLNSEITNVNSSGDILEATDGTNIYNSALNGYNNLYEVASIVNARYQDVINELDVSYSQLQNLNTSSLKTELLKLYGRLPSAMISLTFYDANGRISSQINERQEESFIYYDNLGRQDYITDSEGNVLEKKEYHFGN